MPRRDSECADDSRAYRGAAIDVRPLGGGRSLLVRRLPGPVAVRCAVVSEAAATAVREAGEFRSLGAHAQLAGQRRGLDSTAQSQLHSELVGLATDGFLVPYDALFEPVSSDGADPGLSTIAVPSGNRPALALQTLAGYLELARAEGRPIDALVVDTSVDAQHAEDYRRGLMALQPRAPGSLRYFGPQQVEEHALRVAGAGIDPQLVRFACADPMGTGQAYGAARNRVLLDTVGSLALSVDDDVTASFAPSPAPRPGLAVFTSDGPGYRNYDPHDYWFHDDRSQTEASQHPLPIDVFAEHERVLGRTVRALLSEHGQAQVDISELLDPLRLESIAAGRARLPISFFGLRGDAGMYAPTWHLLKTGPSRQRLHQSEQSYRRAITSRELTRCVPRPTLTDGRWYQGTMIGLDNRQLLPPTVPVMRYEDGVFRVALHRTLRDAMCAHLPWSALHERPSPPAWEPDMVWRTGTWTRMGELLVRAVLDAPVSGPDPGDRLRALGRHLHGLGRLPIDAFFEWVQVQTLRQKAYYIEHLEQLLARHGGEPRWWAADVERHLHGLTRAIHEPEFFVPQELRQRGSLEDARALTRTLVRQYGRLLKAWPEIIEATRAGPRPSAVVEG